MGVKLDGSPDFENISVENGGGNSHASTSGFQLLLFLKGTLKATLVLIATLGVFAAAYFVYDKVSKLNLSGENKPLRSTPPVVTVTLSPASMRTLDDVLNVTGTVAPWDELKVCPEISGLLINSVKVEEGVSVKRGQILATLNSTLLEDQIEEAEAKMRSGQAGFDKALQPNRPEEILMLKAALEQAKNARNQEEANVDKAHIALASAKINVQRFKRLFEQGAISEAEKENHQLILDNAKVELLSAEQREKASLRQEEQVQQRLLEATRGGRREDVLVSQAGIEVVRAQIKHLHGQLAQTIVRAPDDGVILRRDAHIGDTSAAGKALFTMSRRGLLELRAAINDSDLSRLKVGQTVALITNGEEDSKISGKIKLLSPQVDASTRLGVARIDIPNNSGLKPGMFVSGEIGLSSRSLLTVPVESLVTRSGKTFVFVAKQGRAHSVPVVTGLRSNSYVEIKSGLKKGQLVLEKGARFISDNDVVDVTK